LTLPSYRVIILKTILEKGGDDPEKKTRCFGGFCSNLQVKLASKIAKIPEI